MCKFIQIPCMNEVHTERLKFGWKLSKLWHLKWQILFFTWKFKVNTSIAPFPNLNIFSSNLATEVSFLCDFNIKEYTNSIFQPLSKISRTPMYTDHKSPLGVNDVSWEWRVLWSGMILRINSKTKLWFLIKFQKD